MSHFTVLVVLPKGAEEGALARALQPFHEFECTGTRDEYVVFVDEEAEYREEYDRLATRWKDPADGKLYIGYEDVFYRGASDAEKKKLGNAAGTGCVGDISYTNFYDRYKTGPDGTRLMVKMEPSVLGFKPVQVSGGEAHGPFGDWAREHHGAVEQGGRWGRMTNPNAKWDWWVVGGRWSGLLLLLKQGAEGVKGKPGLNPNIGSPERTAEADKAGVDIARRGDIDLACMKMRNVRERRAGVDAAIEAIMKHQKCTREEVLARWAEYSAAIVQARKDWEAGGQKVAFWDYTAGRTDLPVLARERMEDSRKPTAAMLSHPWFGAGVPEECSDLEAYITSAPALSTFAVLKDGQWHERGSMGWWGVVHDEKDGAEWARQYDKLLEELDPDSVLAVVDCHI